ncbi:hypothetical protein EJ08DRAFT_654115 [Tothia fuscella]|uniref:Zn(2)-C6 fungal-type domain-containing protein n=1 Tax=Tothia fuscella TaxID=1048955 RepID=A0A9P4TTB8_9PEZI|nr:hypothetical protein EJ08DRAFT_654115 [Tothia fuscella]
MAADTITIPSPLVFLTASSESAIEESHDCPSPKPAQISITTTKAKQQRKRNTTITTKLKTAEKAGETSCNGVEKKKQSKSRNGCVTCKAKRLKCDETKPTCQQCARRSVDCGGYRKDYKWRPFGEMSFTTGRPPGAKNKKDIVITTGHKPTPSQSTSPIEIVASGFEVQPFVQEEQTLKVEVQNDSDQAVALPQLHKEDNTSGEVSPEMFSLEDALSGFPMSPAMMNEPFPDMPGMPEENSNLQDLETGMPLFSEAEMIDATAAMMDFDQSISPPLLTPLDMGDHIFFNEDDEDVEDIMRNDFEDMDQKPWVMSLPDFYTSSMSSMGSLFPNTNLCSVPRGLDLPANGPEMLTLRFDRQTCGILSVKDGPTENPWRTLIWPLARDSPALYHAIASMTSFHTSKYQPELRVQGIDHMRTSIEALANGIATMRFDTAIATTLALAFAESWDTHVSTGINHIKGAKILVNQALTRHRQVAFAGEELERLKFLCNAWVYMDVLARLTSEDDDESNDFDAVYSKLAEPFQGESHLDPLMGAASTLFPIIGRVANLVRKVRRCNSNSPSIISHAMELKKLLQDWDPPALELKPEDPSIDLQHALQTAEAYRWATLLYLHQAVPEIPSETSVELGKKVMVYLATVPLSSRTVIVQIYPLIAASCEALDEEDRQWVRDRWLSMAQRMKIGVIDRCAEVVKEVWDRRDEYELCTSKKIVPLKQELSFDMDGSVMCGLDIEWGDPFGERRRRLNTLSLPNSNLNCPRKASRDAASGEVDHAFTARGRLHWLGVMKEWNWEVLLG